MKKDLNTTKLRGVIAAEPEIRVFDSGSRLIRYLITVRAERPRRRVDVIPVVIWDPTDEQVESPGEKGARIEIAGAVQRRFWESPDGRRSRLEVVAEKIVITEVEELAPAGK